MSYFSCDSRLITITIAIITIAHPINSLADNSCPNISHPAITEMVDSKLKIRDATVGFIPFWPTICNVYPTPDDNAPAYKIGIHACKIESISGVSNRNIPIDDNTAQVKNWIHDIFTPLQVGAK